MSYVDILKMKVGCFLIIIAFVVAEDQDQHGKIFGGRDAYEGEFPFSVFIWGNPVCGGSVLTLSKIITAGHCFRFVHRDKVTIQDLKTAVVMGGTVNLVNRGTGFQEKKIQNYTVHEGYSRRQSGVFVHDIAVAHLSSPFAQTETLQPFKIPAPGAAKFKQSWENWLAGDKLCFSIGWGKTAYKETNPIVHSFSPFSSTLKVIEVKPWSNKKCQEALKYPKDKITEFGEICASPLTPGEGFCDGDSGSPLMCGNFVYGFTIASVDCHNISKPQYYLLFWNYIDYFGLDVAYSYNNAFTLPQNIIILITCMYLLLKRNKNF